MKNLNLYSLLILSAFLTLSACTPKHSDSKNVEPNANVAAVSLPAECAGPQNQQSLPYYQDAQNANLNTYTWDQRGNFRRGGCRRGTFAACGKGVGMICVPGSAVRTNDVAWYNYVQGPRQFSFCGYQNPYNEGSCSYRSVPGAGNIGRACLVRDPGSCGGFGVCRPVSCRSRLGVCSR